MSICVPQKVSQTVNLTSGWMHFNLDVYFSYKYTARMTLNIKTNSIWQIWQNQNFEILAQSVLLPAVGVEVILHLMSTWCSIMTSKWSTPVQPVSKGSCVTHSSVNLLTLIAFSSAHFQCYIIVPFQQCWSVCPWLPTICSHLQYK